MGDPIRVLVADHSAFVRRAVERMLSSMPEISVVGEAATGEEAIALARQLRPDVLILDVDMPEIDGIEALRTIMAEAPTAVLMLSPSTRRGARTALQALEAGAVDFLDRSPGRTEMDIYDLAPQLREKVLAVAGAAMAAADTSAGAGASTAAMPGADASAGAGTAEIPDSPVAPEARSPVSAAQSRYEVVVIGASTGGPRALAEVLAELPPDFPCALVIAQHMPPGFTLTLADRLDRRCALQVREACDGDRIAPGNVLVSPGGAHVEIERRAGRLRLRVDSGPTDLIYRPSVDRLFRSAAEACGPRAVGVVLTGMGDDGSRGLAALRDAGGYTLAESEATAIIFGMPRAAAAAAERVLPLPRIAPFLATLCSPAISS